MLKGGFPGGAGGKELAYQCRRRKRRGFNPWSGRSSGSMATYSGILAWEIPWTEEPGELWIIGSQRVGHD